MKGFDNMYKIHLTKKAKEIISIASLLIVVILVAYFFCNITKSKYEKAGKFCDSLKGSTCTHYEVESILKRGY